MTEFDPLVQRLPLFSHAESTGSTNTDLIHGTTDGSLPSFKELPDFAVRVADFQNAGRGRSGRTWLAPAGSSLFVSVLLKPSPAISVECFSWLPLMAGLAMSRAVRGILPSDLSVGIKWPNDVLISSDSQAAQSFGGHLKVSGVLSELLPDLSGVVVGAGLNLTQTRDELPVETATSIRLALAEANRESEQPTRAEMLGSYLDELQALYRPFVSAAGDAQASGLRDAVLQNCFTLDRRVRVILPDASEQLGVAKGIDFTGRLQVLFDHEDAVRAVAAGDVMHLRHN